MQQAAPVAAGQRSTALLGKSAIAQSILTPFPIVYYQKEAAVFLCYMCASFIKMFFGSNIKKDRIIHRST